MGSVPDYVVLPGLFAEDAKCREDAVKRDGSRTWHYLAGPLEERDAADVDSSTAGEGNRSSPVGTASG